MQGSLACQRSQHSLGLQTFCVLQNALGREDRAETPSLTALASKTLYRLDMHPGAVSRGPARCSLPITSYVSIVPALYDEAPQ